jgi:hypothetical protein
MSSLMMMRWPSKGTLLSLAARLPVAITVTRAFTSRTPPLFTSRRRTVNGPTKLASALITSTRLRCNWLRTKSSSCAMTLLVRSSRSCTVMSDLTAYASPYSPRSS